MIKDKKTVDITEPYEIKDSTIKFKNKFEVIREDELTEMVWALQNAGHAILYQEEFKENERVKRLVSGIEYEMDAIRYVIDNNEKLCRSILKFNIYIMKFKLISTENLLREPPAITKFYNLITALRSLCLYCDRFNDAIDCNLYSRKSISLIELIPLLDEIKKLRGEVIKELKVIKRL